MQCFIFGNRHARVSHGPIYSWRILEKLSWPRTYSPDLCTSCAITAYSHIGTLLPVVCEGVMAIYGTVVTDVRHLTECYLAGNPLGLSHYCARPDTREHDSTCAQPRPWHHPLLDTWMKQYLNVHERTLAGTVKWDLIFVFSVGIQLIPHPRPATQ